MSGGVLAWYLSGARCRLAYKISGVCVFTSGAADFYSSLAGLVNILLPY